MSNEPNNAEEQLRRYAEERRKEAPSEMHAAARRLLQSEIARVYKAENLGAAPWWRRFQLRWAVAVIAVAAVSVMTLKQERPSQVQQPAQETATGATAQMDAALPASAAASSLSKAKENTLELSVEASNNRFANNITTPVLHNFAFEESGQIVNVRDADGSTYAGRVLATTANARAFTAAGTNQTLQQSVVFTGEVVRLLASPQRAQVPQLNESRQQSLRLASEQLRVQGQALVGSTNRFEIDALNSNRGQ